MVFRVSAAQGSGRFGGRLFPDSFLTSTAGSHLWPTRRSRRLHSRGTEQVAQADQVVGDHVQAEHSSDLWGAAQLELPQPAPLFDPAKHLFNPAAGVDRLAVALMPCGSAIDRGTTRASGVLGHVRCHGDAAHVGLRDPASDDQGMAVVHQPMAPVARQGGVGIRRPGQQRVRIDAGAMGLVAELDATEVALVAPPRSASGLGKGTLLAVLGSTKTLTRA